VWIRAEVCISLLVIMLTGIAHQPEVDCPTWRQQQFTPASGSSLAMPNCQLKTISQQLWLNHQYYSSSLSGHSAAVIARSMPYYFINRCNLLGWQQQILSCNFPESMPRLRVMASQ
jgi:hypothetical protein